MRTEYSNLLSYVIGNTLPFTRWAYALLGYRVHHMINVESDGGVPVLVKSYWLAKNSSP